MPNRSAFPVPSSPRSAALIVCLLLAAAASGLRADLLEVGSRLLHPVDAGGVEEPNDRFGAALAAGDFDDDGFTDLAIGVPDEDVGSIVDAGAVYVVFGSRAGLGYSNRAPVGIHQDVTNVNDDAESFDRFGSVLAVGDFDGDGDDDLAVGVPGENIGTLLDTGAVQVFRGGASGLDLANDLLFGGAAFSAGDNDEFGATMVACDRDGDGRDELVVGAPGWNSAEPSAGRVLVLPGTASGPTSTGALSIQPAPVDAGDRFGSALACDDTTGDGLADLLVGAPFGDYPNGPPNEGVVWTIRTGGATTSEGGWEGGAEAGTAVALARFSGGPATSLFGIPASGFAGEDSSGVLIVGSIVTQDDAPYNDDVKPFDRFGEILGVGDFDDDGADDVVVGVPSENLDDHLADSTQWKLDAGLVHVDMNDTGSNWSLPAPAECTLVAVADRNEPMRNARFGAAVAAGDFDGNGWLDLAAGAPTASCDQSGAGLVRIVYGWHPDWIFGDGFERSDVSAWSTAAP